MNVDVKFTASTSVLIVHVDLLRKMITCPLLPYYYYYYFTTKLTLLIKYSFNIGSSASKTTFFTVFDIISCRTISWRIHRCQDIHIKAALMVP